MVAAAWRSFSFKTSAADYPLSVQAVERPGAATDCLDRLVPPAQVGPHRWWARVCYWSPRELLQLQAQHQPLLAYRLDTNSCSRQVRASWDALVQQLQATHDAAAAAAAGAAGNAGVAAAPAAASAAGSQGGFRNVLLLHVAGRYSDYSIYMLLLPNMDEDGTTMLCAYTLVLEPFGIKERLSMAADNAVAPLSHAAAMRALASSRRSQERYWDQCVAYQQSQKLQHNGLPCWMRKISMSPHVALLMPCLQLDFVDCCYINRGSSCCSGSGGGRAASAGSSSARRSVASDRAADACADVGSAERVAYTSAGAMQLRPWLVGAPAQFLAPCSCDATLWCGGAGVRKQLWQLWSGEAAPRLSIKAVPKAAAKGFGVFADEPLPLGTPVGEYCGELLSMQELALRERLYLSASPPLLYLWTESEDGGLAPSLALQDVQPSGARRARLRAAEDAAQPLAIDATFVGGVTRLINHSCKPNCIAVKACMGGGSSGEPVDGGASARMLVLFVTQRDVAAGEELTVDYSPPDADDGEPAPKRRALSGVIKCECGAGDKCRGTVFPCRAAACGNVRG